MPRKGDQDQQVLDGGKIRRFQENVVESGFHWRWSLFLIFLITSGESKRKVKVKVKVKEKEYLFINVVHYLFFRANQSHRNERSESEVRDVAGARQLHLHRLVRRNQNQRFWTGNFILFVLQWTRGQFFRKIRGKSYDITSLRYNFFWFTCYSHLWAI